MATHIVHLATLQCRQQSDTSQRDCGTLCFLSYFVSCCTTVPEIALEKNLQLGEWRWRSPKVIENGAYGHAICRYFL